MNKKGRSRHFFQAGSAFLDMKMLKTIHGKLETPFFMPDATRALVKGLTVSELENTGIKACVVNTFHLYLQPGLKVIKKFGGIHSFMGYSGPLLSDSGGYQVFSLIHKNPKMGKITDEGAFFRSPLDGSKHLLTPERSIQIQFDLGVDMMVVLDDCSPYGHTKTEIERSVDRTITWAKRCKQEYEKQIKKRELTGKKKPLLFGVIQGALHKDLRKKCAQGLLSIGFDGYGFGGRPVDDDGRFISDILKYTAQLIPDDKLKFALGVGTFKDIKKCSKMGWDMFDCVIPTREGRHGRLFRFSGQGSININNSKFSADIRPINKESKSKELKDNSLAFLHHLFKVNDPLGPRLATLNNLEFYSKLMNELK